MVRLREILIRPQNSLTCHNVSNYLLLIRDLRFSMLARQRCQLTNVPLVGLSLKRFRRRSITQDGWVSCILPLSSFCEAFLNEENFSRLLLGEFVRRHIIVKNQIKPFLLKIGSYLFAAIEMTSCDVCGSSDAVFHLEWTNPDTCVKSVRKKAIIGGLIGKCY